jgi:hypothetical protein
MKTVRFGIGRESVEVVLYDFIDGGVGEGEERGSEGGSGGDVEVS